MDGQLGHLEPSPLPWWTNFGASGAEGYPCFERAVRIGRRRVKGGWDRKTQHLRQGAFP